jgi:hypothetical protein
MARIVSRRPLIGVVAGVLFGSLGWLLLGMEGTRTGVTSLAPLLFKVSGGFFLFVGVIALAAAFLSILRSARSD